MSERLRMDGINTKLPNAILGELSKKYNLSEHIIEHIVRSEFRFIEYTLKKREYVNIRLHYLGVFGIPEKRRAKILNKIKAKKQINNINNNDVYKNLYREPNQK